MIALIVVMIALTVVRVSASVFGYGSLSQAVLG